MDDGGDAPASVPQRRDWRPVSGPRYPALVCALLLASGIFIGDALDWGALVWAVAAVATVLAALFLRRAAISRPIAATVCVTLSITALGAFRIASVNANRPSPELAELGRLHKRTEIFARIDGVPYQRSSGWRVPLGLIAATASGSHRPVRGRVLLTSVLSLQHLRFGDHVRLVGRFREPSPQRNPGGFDYAEYLFRQGIDGTLAADEELAHWPSGSKWAPDNLVQPVRQWIRDALTTTLPDEPSALLLGLLLGDTDRLPESVSRAFRQSGTSHLLAVSGANVWLVVGMILWPLYALSVPRWPRTVIALILIVLFSFLTRNEPSVVRASLMVALILVGRLMWRPVSPINAVGAAAVIILLIAPAQLFRAGFQLSFAAVLAILIAARRIDPLLSGWWRRKLPYGAAMFVVSTIAATAATGPISAVNFGTFPVAGVLANMVMVPLAGLAAHLGLITLGLHLFSHSLSGWAALVATPILYGSARVAEFFSRVPGAVVSWPDPSPLALLILISIAALALSWRHRYRWFRPAVYVAVGLLVCFSLRQAITPARSSPILAFLDDGSHTLVAVADASGRATWLADDPGIDSDTRQWTVEPFSRRIFHSPAPTSWSGWRRADTLRIAPSSPVSDAPTWTRYVNTGTDEYGKHHVWADCLRRNGKCLVVIRDPAAMDDSLLLNRLAFAAEGICDLAMPMMTQRKRTRLAVERLRPSQVVFYGALAYDRRPEDILDFWRLRYLDTKFYSTGVHGAIRVEFGPDRLQILPTLPDFLTGDA